MVCIESIITISGCSLSTSARIISKLLSAKTKHPSVFTESRSALILICISDSSPLQYSTVFPIFVNESHICKIRVDFPIPGSPPQRITESETIPPPNGRSNSVIPNFTLSVSFISISVKLVGSFPD